MNSTHYRYITKRENLNDCAYFLLTVFYHIAPTSAGLKPSSLVSFTNKGRNLFRLWDLYRCIFANDSAIQFFELKKDKKKSLVLFYNPSYLQDVIFDYYNMDFLASFGYHHQMTLGEVLELLKARFSQGCPHEVGIFLGIPRLDVEGFIKNKGQNSLTSGYWKVYSDVGLARQTFKDINHAKECVLNELDRLL